MAPQQNQKITIVCIPDQVQLSMVCAAFIQYALTMGFDKSQATQAYMAAQVVLMESMRNAPLPMQKAPRMWWQLLNALQSKTIFYKGADITYKWDMDLVAPDTGVNKFGFRFGALEAGNTPIGGLYTISDTAGVIKDLAISCEQLTSVFEYFGDAHPMIECPLDFCEDVSAFATKTSLFADQNRSDQTKSSYSVCYHEVPIISYWGCCGFAKAPPAGSKDSFRVPRFTKFSQGHAGNHVGMRLHFPKFMAKQFVHTTPDFRMYDLGKWFEVDTQMRATMKQMLNNANRTQSDATSSIPDGYVNVPMNEAILSRIFNFAAASLMYPAAWFGTSQTLVAIAAGTNNIDSTLPKGRGEASWSVANQRQLTPLYNRNSNRLIIPVPTISNSIVSELWNLFPNSYNQTDTDIYGGTRLDILNSMIGSALVSMINGPSARAGFLGVDEIDNTYTAVVQTSPVEPVSVQPDTKKALEQDVLSLEGTGRSKSDVMADVFRKFGGKDWERNLRKHLANIENQKSVHASIKSDFRQSPSLIASVFLGQTTCSTFDEGRGLEDNLQGPVTLYEPSAQSITITQLVHEQNHKFVPGDFNTLPVTVIQELMVAGQYATDPNTTHDTQVMSDINRSLDVANQNTRPDWAGFFESALSILPGRLGMAGKMIIPFIPSIKKGVEGIRQRRQQRKDSPKPPKRK
jgi:hypothetical protein